MMTPVCMGAGANRQAGAWEDDARREASGNQVVQFLQRLNQMEKIGRLRHARHFGVRGGDERTIVAGEENHRDAAPQMFVGHGKVRARAQVDIDDGGVELSALMRELSPSKLS
jgi:hypothetical protein